MRSQTIEQFWGCYFSPQFLSLANGRSDFFKRIRVKGIETVWLLIGFPRSRESCRRGKNSYRERTELYGKGEKVRVTGRVVRAREGRRVYMERNSKGLVWCKARVLGSGGGRKGLQHKAYECFRKGWSEVFVMERRMGCRKTLKNRENIVLGDTELV